MTPPLRHFVVVYQFGKVASNSVVATLSAMPGVEAVQAHFLGRESLREMVDIIIDPGTSDYFLEHQIGQFVANAETTRRIETYRRGKERGSVLSIVSIVRDPFQWFRSSLVQDINAYLPVLRALPACRTRAAGAEEDVVRALEWMCVQFSEAARELGGINSIINSKSRDRAIAQHPLFLERAELLPLFYLMLRPFSWFEAHFRKALGCCIEDLAEPDRYFLHRDVEWASIFVLRYEDLADHLALMAERLGIGPVGPLARENVSESKVLSGSVRLAFESSAGAALRDQFALTDYSRRFGYS